MTIRDRMHLLKIKLIWLFFPPAALYQSWVEITRMCILCDFPYTQPKYPHIFLPAYLSNLNLSLESKSFLPSTKLFRFECIQGDD